MTLKTRTPRLLGLRIRGINVGHDFVADWVDIEHIAEDGSTTTINLDSTLEPGSRVADLAHSPWEDALFAVRLWTSGTHRVSVSRHPLLRDVPPQEVDISGYDLAQNMLEFRR